MTREEALDIFKCLAWHDLRPSEEEIEMAFKVLSDKPSGKWIEHSHERGLDWEFSAYECSNCHEWFDDDSNYCPNCGAKMVEEQGEAEW